MILIIDSSYLCYRSQFALRGLNYKEQETGVIFGFLNYVLSLSEKFQTNRLVFAWDSQRSLRKRIYPAYKGNRATPDREMQDLRDIARPQKELLRAKILPEIGLINNFSQPGYEADDIIAKIVFCNNEDFMVVANDSDLFQLLDYCRIYDPALKQVMDRKWFQAKTGLKMSSDWAAVKAIAGCSTDNVAGITGVGEKTAIMYLKGDLKVGKTKYDSIISKAGQEVIKRNMPLVKLPFAGTKPIYNLQWNALNIDAFMEVCRKYNLMSFINTGKFEKWQKLLGGTQ
jgi:DNA polymerase I